MSVSSASGPLAAHIGDVEARLREFVGELDPSLAGIAIHLIDAGGKRLRPQLVVSSAIAAGGREAVTSRVIDAAAAVELLHLASLCHDDVLDRAPLRRGQPSANALWGDRRPILAGDTLLALAFQAASRLRPEELQRFCETVSELCAGQVAECELQFDPGRGVDDYEMSIRRKTAALLSASCWLGASVTGARSHVAAALERYGAELGVAFQVIDDVLDLCADGCVTGKPCAGDVRGGVFTLPVLLALADDPGLRELLVDGIDEDGIDEVRRRVSAVGGDRLAVSRAAWHVGCALGCISEGAVSAEGWRLLVSIAHSVLEPVARDGFDPYGSMLDPPQLEGGGR